MAYFDEMAVQAGQVIYFTSMATGESVAFPAFITNFADNYNVGWSGDTTFGRVDPVRSYQSTSRSITAAFDIVGRSKEVAIQNFENYSKLIRMLYPTYGPQIGASGNVRTIKAAPLFRIRYANYIHSEKDPVGLLGTFGGVNFTPDFGGGHFLEGSPGDPIMIPVIYNMSINFTPMHEKILGSEHGSGTWLGGDQFPYKLGDFEGKGTSPASESSVLGLY